MNEFGMVSVIRHSITQSEFGDTRADADDDSRVAISERKGFVQPIEDRLERWQQSIRLDLGHDLLDAIWILTSLGQETRFAKLNQRTLRSRRNQACPRLHEQMSRRRLWTGDFQ
jgi:hypothetical protein